MSSNATSAGAARYHGYLVHRSISGWKNYIEELRRVGRLVEIDGVAIDGESMFRRRFRCDPRTCAPGVKPGTKERWRESGQKSCCAELTVDLTAEERAALEARWGEVSGWLGAQDSYFRGRPLSDMLELGDDYEWSLRKRGGRCIFAIRDREWGLRCGIHAACLALDIPVRDVKPVTCDTFPLLIIDLEPGRFYLGAHDDDVDGLASISDDGVEPFPCLVTKRKGPRMFESMGDVIRSYFGDAFYERLAGEAEAYLARPRPKALVPPCER